MPHRIHLLLTGALATALWAGAALAAAIEDPLGGQTFKNLVENFVAFANYLLAPLSALMVMIGGYFYLTAGGNPEKIKAAHRILTWAVVGIAIVLIANSAQLIIESALQAATSG